MAQGQTKARKQTAPKGAVKAAKPSRARGATPDAPPPAPVAPEAASDLVEEQLAKYRSMRDFGVTAEPSGQGKASARQAAARTSPAKAKSAGGLPFVIQKHAASHLHYDFRLGWSGVLKSWAVAKGPSYYPGDRRLAVQVEDHPMEYGGFEGIIPKGQYGGGTVMVWDQGTWWPQPGHENVDAGLRTGSLKFEMHGAKMRGKWTLVRMHSNKPFPGENGRWRSNDKPQWLLIKEHDEFERPQNAPAVTEDEADSALTGRSIEQIAHAEDHVWNSKETAKEGQAWYRQQTHAGDNASQDEPGAEVRKTEDGTPITVNGEKLSMAPQRRGKQAAATTTPVKAATAKRAPQAASKPAPPASAPEAALPDLSELPEERQPEFLQPELAQETETPPGGNGWLHELKLDGYRMQARKHGRDVQMLTRSGLDWTYRVQAIADAVARLPVENATIDGEVVVLAEDGTTNFANLQASFQQGEKHELTYFCFDLLHLQGHNTRNLPLRKRKELLARVLPAGQDGVVRISEHLETGGEAMFHQACELHAEGIISKRAEAPYRAGRTMDWLKAKCLHEQEFVIGGWNPSSDGPDRIGSLLLGFYREGKLIYAGRAGTGYTQKTRKQLFEQLKTMEVKAAPFTRVPAEARRGGPHWVRPSLVAQVRFSTWTAENFVRHAAFLGLREDKRADEVFQEKPSTAPQPKAPRVKPPAAGGSASQRQAAPVAARVAAARPTAPARPARPAATSPRPAAAKATAQAPVRLTHPSKVLDPESQLTKQQLAEYYWAVAERMLPHVADRPLSLVRCPDGAASPCFYQKHVNHLLPPGVGAVMVKDKQSSAPEPYITLGSPEALAGLAQMGVLEVHPWGSRNEDLEHPDRIIFDLDPDEDLAWSTVTDAAREVRDRLKKAGLESFLKTTGGKGLHIVAPVTPELDFAVVKDTAHQFVMAMERNNPRLYLTKMTKAARKGKIYLDYLRNERGATAVAPFSPRARPGVHVSVTLDWKELDGGERPVFAVTEFASWRNRLRRDPWRRMLTLQQRLDPTRMRAK